jgi:hypothetical protein
VTPPRPTVIPGGQNTGPIRRPRVTETPAVQLQRKFTKTPQGRHYDNGLQLRKGIKVQQAWQQHFFPHGYFHYPRYHPSYVPGQCFISPFGFYFGVCVPFIDISDCHVFPPTVAFIDAPLYDGSNCTGFDDSGTENLLNDANLDQDEPGLSNALDELAETFQNGNIDGIAVLVDPNVSIAIYQRGHYQYSLSPDDYMDITRDSIQSLQTVQFSLTAVHQRAPGVFSACGTHTYRDQNGNEQTVWVSFVLQDISGQWTLTQVETAPGHYQNLMQ